MRCLSQLVVSALYYIFPKYSCFRFSLLNNIIPSRNFIVKSGYPSPRVNVYPLWPIYLLFRPFSSEVAFKRCYILQTDTLILTFAIMKQFYCFTTAYTKDWTQTNDSHYVKVVPLPLGYSRMKQLKVTNFLTLTVNAIFSL